MIPFREFNAGVLLFIEPEQKFLVMIHCLLTALKPVFYHSHVHKVFDLEGFEVLALPDYVKVEKSFEKRHLHRLVFYVHMLSRENTSFSMCFEELFKDLHNSKVDLSRV